MATKTFYQIIDELNQKSDSILANAQKANLVADNMNKTLDGMGVMEVAEVDNVNTIGRDPTAQFDGTPISAEGKAALSDQRGIMNEYLKAQNPNFLQQVGSGIKDYISGGGLIGRIGGGIGSFLNTVFPSSPMDKFNRTFAVQNYGDPYGYGMGSQGIAGQDPFGINTVSGFGDYQKHYQDYLNAFTNQTKLPGLFGYVPSQTSQFAIDKADFAKEVLGLKPDSSNITGTPLITGDSIYQSDGGNEPTGGGSDIGSRVSQSYEAVQDDDYGLL